MHVPLDHDEESDNKCMHHSIREELNTYSTTRYFCLSYRYLIFNWPVLFSCLAILGNFITVTLLYSACVNQFMPNTNRTTNGVTQQQHVTNVQRQNSASQLSNGGTSTAAITTPVDNVETVSSNVEAVGSNVEAVSSNAEAVISNAEAVGSHVEMVNPNVRRPSEQVQENIASTSCEVKKRRYTRVASVKVKFRKKQPRISHAGQKD